MTTKDNLNVDTSSNIRHSPGSTNTQAHGSKSPTDNVAFPAKLKQPRTGENWCNQSVECIIAMTVLNSLNNKIDFTS